MKIDLPNKNKKGQVLIGLTVSIAVLAILTEVVISLVYTSYQILAFTQARTNAKFIALNEIEIIKNLPYNSIGTVGGIPTGVLSQSKTTIRNGLTYTISTSVIYIDDQFDSIAPTDLLPTDYKRARVEVSWPGLAQSKTNPVVLVTDIAPKGVETTNGGGTLSILVFDSSGLPLSQANVHIVASTVNPAVDLNLKTATDGRVILPGAPACNGCYQITVTKSGYSTDRTYSSSEVTNPNKPHQTIIASNLTEVSFSIDLLSSINVTSTYGSQNNFAVYPNRGFALQGTKQIGTDSLNNPVYKYKNGFQTDSLGNLTISNLEWDTYQFTSSDSATLDLEAVNPTIPLIMYPNTQTQFTFAQTSHTANSLRVQFLGSGGSPIASVAATLSQSSIPIATQSSGLSTDPNFGQVYFPSLSSGIYTIDATASGYLPYSAVATVSGQTVENINLTQ